MQREKYKILRSRKIRLSPAFWNGVSQTSPETATIHSARISKLWMIFEQGHLTMVYFADDWESVGQALLERTLREERYLTDIYAEQLKLGKQLVKHSRRTLSKSLEVFTIERLLREYEKLKSLWLSYDRTNVLPWHVMGDYLKDYIYKELHEHSPELTDEDFLLVTMPTSKSFNLEEELASYRLALQMKRHLGPVAKLDLPVNINELPEKVRNLLQRTAEKFGWIPFGYDGPEIWDVHYYLTRINELIVQDESEIKRRVDELRYYDSEIEKKQNTLRQKLRIDSCLWRLIKDLQTAGVMTNQRKEFTFQSHIAINRVMNQIGIQLGIDLESIAYLTDAELAQYKSRSDGLAEIAFRRKGGFFIFEFNDGRYVEIKGIEALNLKKELVPEIEAGDSVSGTVGSKGTTLTVVGKARILHSADEVSKLQTGEILVTSMTSPEYIPAIRKAIAVVTDEGGVTCHAAIVSRELGLPCVIGTGFATSVFSDGDLLEVDVERGAVRRVSEGEYLPKLNSQIPGQIPSDRTFEPKSARLQSMQRWSEDLILELDQLRKEDFTLVGGKAANLGEIFCLCPVPPGFCLTVNAFDSFINRCGLNSIIGSILKKTDFTSADRTKEASNRILELFLACDIPEDITIEVLNRFRKLCDRVAVRSSGISEDLPNASFAGQHETILNVGDEVILLASIKKCWASLFSPRALSYRNQICFIEDSLKMAILIQKMSDAAVSGVMFTANPINNEPEILIECFYGLGENIVSGRVTPERYVMDKDTLSLRSINFRPDRTAPYENAISIEPRPRILNEEQLMELASLGMTIEKHFGFPQDIEWTLEESNFYIMQARPISTLNSASL
jgi:phosphoenolpyruvate synthase/pyruvate phosphate dikinase